MASRSKGAMTGASKEVTKMRETSTSEIMASLCRLKAAKDYAHLALGLFFGFSFRKENGPSNCGHGLCSQTGVYDTGLILGEASSVTRKA